ncbi:hypothetical protein [Patulibacter americanus]|uniref:hypothetical protein n=1 Tax=Patulibacter americanus TaxID=588672 RepID=UPI0003B4B7D4|nr:hypothetical protein [Patulibacter americanus]
MAWVAGVGIGVGLLGGGVAALTLPDERQDGTANAAVRRGDGAPTSGAARAGSAPSTGAAPASAVPAAPPAVRPAVGGAGKVRRVAAARPQPKNPGAVLLRLRGPMRVVVRRPDPAGGPDWAVRVFRADRTFHDPRDGNRLHTIGRNTCVQLGRIHQGRFGWLDGEGTFRPVRPSLFASPASCGSRRADLGGRPYLDALQTLTGTSGATPHLAATVAWGRVGSAARDVRLTVGGGPAAAAAADGVVLDVRAADGAVPRAEVQATYPKRGTRSAKAGGGTGAVLAVRTADPRGGPAYGLSASRSNGRWCMGRVGRVADGRVGTIDYRFGTFRQFPPQGCGGRAGRDPLLPDQMSGGEDLGDDPIYLEGAPRAEGTARRSAPGLTWTAGQVGAGVRSITFRTPRDVRTLAPSAVGNAFLVVYDGQFPSGRSEMVLGLADGRKVRRPLFLGVY